MADLYMSGLTGALDSETIISNLLKIKQQPLTALTQKKALVQAKVSSLSNLLGSIKNFQSFFESLNIDKIFTTKKAISSDNSIFEAKATSNTPNLNMKITVNKLAQTEIRSSTLGMNSLNDTFSSSGTLKLKYWKNNSDVISFDIDYSAGQTLQNFVDKINSSQSFIKASIYFTGTDYRLMLSESDASSSSKETDENNQSFVIEVDSSYGLPAELGNLESLQSAQNASIRIGNSSNPITSPSNTFSNVVTGLDITVKKEGSATLTISDDYSQLNSVLNNFANNYNAVVSIINLMTGKGAQFQGDSAITTIKTSMINLLNPLIQKGLINYSDSDGTISINTENLDKLKSSDINSLKDILNTLNNSFSTQLKSIASTITTYKNTGESQINSINERVSLMQAQLVKYEERLRKEFAQLESFIYQMNQISTRLEDFVVTLSKMTGGKE